MSDKKRIVLAGGGTGGHIFPLVAVAEALEQKYEDVEFLYIGTKSQMGDVAQEAMAELNIQTKNIVTGKMRRYFSPQYFLDIFRIPIGIMQSLFYLLKFMPDAVFSKGGYASVPIVIAAWIYHIPVLTHDSDAVPGWANRICGKLSRYVALSYDLSARYFRGNKIVITGNPIRSEMTNGDRARGYERWGFTESRPTVLIVGGSQGAKAINDAVLRSLPELAKISQVLHITGQEHHEESLRLAGEFGFKSGRHRYVAVPFLNRTEMADAYAVADIIVSRSGANSITEMAATKKVAIFVPLARSANNHQYMNAYEIAKIGGAMVLEETNLGGSILTDKVTQLLHDKELRTQLQEKIHAFYHPDAAEKIADGIIKMIDEK
ncbi:MAG: undecaprenyldiphospho-muramoylpentapeptide beta-N-acetylglucosaminyltransferase [Patescibacteria group bacterium]|nr:undecaprenyldiphospho-muramoylpentapeptide beta-N-acetylglucosaminyltransferase [Patescibacteria group bacterium]